MVQNGQDKAQPRLLESTYGPLLRRGFPPAALDTACAGPYTHWLPPGAHDWQERTHMRPRTLGKILIGVLTFICLVMALLYALASPDTREIYKAFRAITYALMALTFATLYRYFED
jgi:hypothetical protein